MCTAFSYNVGHHYFGRNLDYEYHFEEQVTITPRNFSLPLRNGNPLGCHFAMIGIATIVDGFPLYYDAVNEKGLAMAALNFPGNAKYQTADENANNIAVFELIPWLLAQCENVVDAEIVLSKTRIIDIPFSEQFPTTSLHWILCDKRKTLTLEITKDGMHLYHNPYEVLTNNPPFPYHLENMNRYMNLTAKEPTNRFHTSLPLTQISRGMGAIGLPGDLSSSSRFVRAAFVKWNVRPGENDTEDITQCFHLLSSVEQQDGCVAVNDLFEKTIYSSCCNTDTGVYYYTTYGNHQITAINMHNHDLNSNILASYPLIMTQRIHQGN